jgi:hypothetical protein
MLSLYQEYSLPVSEGAGMARQSNDWRKARELGFDSQQAHGFFSSHSANIGSEAHSAARLMHTG